MAAKRRPRRSTLVVVSPGSTMPPILGSPDTTPKRRTRSSKSMSISTTALPIVSPSSTPVPPKRKGSQPYFPHSPSGKMNPAEWSPSSPTCHPTLSSLPLPSPGRGAIGLREVMGLPSPRIRRSSGSEIATPGSVDSESSMILLPPGQMLSPPIRDGGMSLRPSGNELDQPRLPSLGFSSGETSLRSSLADIHHDHDGAYADPTGTQTTTSSGSLVNGLPVPRAGLRDTQAQGTGQSLNLPIDSDPYQYQSYPPQNGHLTYGLPSSLFDSLPDSYEHSNPIRFTHIHSPGLREQSPGTTRHAGDLPSLPLMPRHPFPMGIGIDGRSIVGQGYALRISNPPDQDPFMVSHAVHDHSESSQNATIASNRLQPPPGGSYFSHMADDDSGASTRMPFSATRLLSTVRAGNSDSVYSDGSSSGSSSAGDDDDDDGEDGMNESGPIIPDSDLVGNESHTLDQMDSDSDANIATSEPAAALLNKPSNHSPKLKTTITIKIKRSKPAPLKRPTVAPEHWVHDNMRSLAASLSPNRAEFDQQVKSGSGGSTGILAGLSHLSAADRLAAAEKALSNGPPRPPNAWILYRSDKLRALANGEKLPGVEAILRQKSTESSSEDALAKAAARKPSKKAKSILKEAQTTEETMAKPEDIVPRDISPKIAQADISKLISLLWKKEGKAVRVKYDRMAEAKKMEHQQMYPDYKFQPMKKEDKAKLKVQRDLAKEQAKAAAKLDKQNVRKEQAEIARKERQAERLAERQSCSQMPRKHAPGESGVRPLGPQGAGPTPDGALGHGDIAADPKGAKRSRSGAPVKGARASRKKKSSATRPIFQGGPPPDWVATEDSIWRQPPSTGQAREVFWAVPPENIPPATSEFPGYTGIFDPRDQGQYQIMEIPYPQPPSLPAEQYRTLSYQQPRPQVQVSGWSSQVPSGPEPQQYMPEIEAGYAVEGQQIIPYYFEPIPHNTQIIEHPDVAMVASGSGIPPPRPIDQPAAMTYSYLPDGGFGASAAVPGVSEAELAEMWALLQEEEVPGPEVWDNAPQDQQETWSGDPAVALEQWAELGRKPSQVFKFSHPTASKLTDRRLGLALHLATIQDMTPVPANTLSGQIAQSISQRWAGDSAQARQDLREARAVPHATMGSIDHQDGPVPGSTMSYEKPGYVTIQVPIDQMSQAFPGQSLSMRNRGQGPFLTPENPISPIDMGFASRLSHQGGRHRYGAMPEHGGSALDIPCYTQDKSGRETRTAVHGHGQSLHVTPEQEQQAAFASQQHDAWSAERNPYGALPLVSGPTFVADSRHFLESHHQWDESRQQWEDTRPHEGDLRNGDRANYRNDRNTEPGALFAHNTDRTRKSGYHLPPYQATMDDEPASSTDWKAPHVMDHPTATAAVNFAGSGPMGTLTPHRGAKRGRVVGRGYAGQGWT